MPTWRVQRNQDSYEPDLYNTQVVDTANPFGSYGIAKIDDTNGKKFEQYPRGTRVDFFVVDSDNVPLIVSSGETKTIGGDGYGYTYGSSYGTGGGARDASLVEVDGTLQVEGTLRVTSTQTRKLPGYVVERRELDNAGADALEIEVYSFDQFLRRDTVSNSQADKTITAALEDIIKTDTPVTWNASNVNVVDDQTLTQSYRGNKVENVLLNLRSKSAGEDFGVNDDLEFFWRPQESSSAPRDVDDSQALNWDIPELGKETVNEVTVFYDGGDKSVTVDDGSDKKALQENLNTPDPVTFQEEVSRPDITDIEDARAVGEQILANRNTTLTGTVTTFGLLTASPGDIINIDITSRGISDDFRIAELDYRWGKDQTILTIVEKKGDQDELLVRLSDSVKRLETQDVNRDAIQNRITSTSVNAEITVGGDVAGTSYTAFRYTNVGRNLVRDGWSGDGNLDIAEIAVGDDSTQPTRSQTSLGNELERVSVSESLPDSKTVEYSGDVSTTDIREVGLFTSSGDMVARAIIPSTSLSSPVSVSMSLAVSNDADVANGVITDTGQTVVRDILADNSPSLPKKYAFGSDGSDPSVTDTSLGTQETVEDLTELLVQSADSTSSFQEITPDVKATDAWEITSGQINTLQSCFNIEGENYDRSGGGNTTVSDTDASGGTAERFDSAGTDWAEWDFTLDYDIPAGDFEIHYRNQATGSDVPDIEWSLDGEVIGPTNALTDYSWNEVYAPNNATPDKITAGTHTIRAEVVGSGSDGRDIDVVAPLDERFSYTFDNTVDSNDALEGPELFPDLLEIEFNEAKTRRKLDQATCEQTWNDVTNKQKIELSNDGGSTWITTNNSQTATASFSSLEIGVRTRVGLSRFGSQTSTPTTGISAQNVSAHDLFANVDAITAVDIGVADVRAIVQPNTITGVTLREAGQLDTNDNLLTSVVFAEFTVGTDERIISSERVEFKNPD